MRLLHTTDLIFREFYDSQIPKYVILSHRWTGDEVSFEEFYDIKAQDSSGERFAKIRNCCAYAREYGHAWIWIDTCCIDKKSSAELSEAINSMFNWYKNAAMCYVYLADVLWDSGNREQSRDNFRKSVWFDRGWTLQELLAPSNLHFLDRTWSYIGDVWKASDLRASESQDLVEDVSSRTGVSEIDLLNMHYSFHRDCVSVARKFSWLSNRETSRIEDMAYCMLGLCGVNMPLLYGEGEKAFTRLQLEIIRASDDESIFAWFSEGELYGIGVLASSPKEFARSGQVIRKNSLRGKKPFTMTNKGLHYQVPIPKGWTISAYVRGSHEYHLCLGCELDLPDGGSDLSRGIVITLMKIGDTWGRIDCEQNKEVGLSTWRDAIAEEHEYQDLYLRPTGR